MSRDNFYYLKPKEGGDVFRVSAEKLSRYQATRQYVTATAEEWDEQRRRSAPQVTKVVTTPEPISDGLDKLTVPKLREIAASEAGTAEGKKDELIAAIRAAREKAASGDPDDGAGDALESLSDEALVAKATGLGIVTDGLERDALISAITDKLADSPEE